ncbi:hypothetical protein BDR26DRAFT_1012344 [Obelidium mucronatum]|nr:hypothetical protein BDR26DRAFT_1012344 [Obelidium mucronatum]
MTTPPTYAFTVYFYNRRCDRSWVERIDMAASACDPSSSIAELPCRNITCAAAMAGRTPTRRRAAASLPADAAAPSSDPARGGALVTHAAERVTRSFEDASVFWSFFSDAYCDELITATRFAFANHSCADGHTARVLNDHGFKQTAIYSGAACTGTPTTDANCTVPDFIESVALDTCQMKSDGDSFKAILDKDGKSVIYSLYGDAECKVLTDNVTYSGTGECRASVKGQLSTFAIPSSSASKTPTILGIVWGAFGVAIVAAGIIWFCRRHRRNAKSRANKTEIPRKASSTSSNKSGNPFLVIDHGQSSSSHHPHHHRRSRDDYADSLSGGIELEEFEVVHVLEEPRSSSEVVVVVEDAKRKENPLFAGMSQATSSHTPSTRPKKEEDAYKLETALLESETQDDAAPLHTLAHRESSSTIVDGISVHPKEWSVEQVADWVSNNGGHAEPVLEQKIDGLALLELSLEELFTVLRISTVGERLQFRRAMQQLTAAPPTYDEA